MEGRIWVIQATYYTKFFPRFLGNVSTYTPLPPIEGQDPASLRVLVHKREDSGAAAYAVDSKLSTNGTPVRISHLSRGKHRVRISDDVRQVIVCASGVTGIAPMLRTIHTLLETRRGDGIKSRRPDIFVVWFKQSQDLADESGMASAWNDSLEGSTADKIASAELERLRVGHPDKLAVERQYGQHLCERNSIH